MARRVREGRGWLSTIETLPEEADEHIAWANAQLREREMPQTEILREFNARLADLGIKGVSKSAFSRYSVRLAVELRKMDASRRITDEVLARMAPGDRSDAMIAATELLKVRVLEMVTAQEEPDPKLINIASLAMQRLSATALREAQGQRLDRKEEREAEAAAQETAEKVEEIAEEARTAADPAEVLRRIREDVYGIFER